MNFPSFPSACELLATPGFGRSKGLGDVNHSRGLAMDSLLRVEFCDAGSWLLLNKNKGETFARDRSEDGGCAPIPSSGTSSCSAFPVTAPPGMRRKRPNDLALRQRHVHTRNSPFLLLGRQRMMLDTKVDASSGLVNTRVVPLNGFLFSLAAYAGACGGFAGTAGILTVTPTRWGMGGVGHSHIRSLVGAYRCTSVRRTALPSKSGTHLIPQCLVGSLLG